MRLLRPFKFCLHINSLSRNDARAFTLAEILITLGIIGIVAAMTIPTLMQSLEANQYKVAYKKAYANLNNAVLSANANNELKGASTTTEFHNIFLTIMSEFKVIEQCTSGDNSKCWDNSGEKYHKIFPSSSQYSFIDSSGVAWSQLWNSGASVLIDTNGFKQPNQMGKDRFALGIADNNGISEPSIGIPVKVILTPDNFTNACEDNKCGTVGDPDYNTYYGTSWILGK